MQDNYLGKRPSQVPRSMNKVCAKIQSADSSDLPFDVFSNLIFLQRIIS